MGILAKAHLRYVIVFGFFSFYQLYLFHSFKRRKNEGTTFRDDRHRNASHLFDGRDDRRADPWERRNQRNFGERRRETPSSERLFKPGKTVVQVVLGEVQRKQRLLPLVGLRLAWLMRSPPSSPFQLG